MKATLVILAISLSFCGISEAVVPDLFIDGHAIDPSIYRLNNTSDDLTFTFESNRQSWNLLSDIPMNNSTRANFGLYSSGNGYGKNYSIIFNGNTGNPVSQTTNFAPGTDVGFWLSHDIGVNSRLNGRNSVLHSERAFSVGDKNSEHQSFIMYDVRGFEGSEYSFGDWSGSGDYDYLIFIEDKHTDGIDHDDMVVGMMVAPEPGTLILLGSGLIGTGLALRRKKKK